MADRTEQLHPEEDRIARHNLLAEFHIVDLKEIGGPTLRILDLVEHQQTTTLAHGLDQQHTRHDWLLGEVALEEGLVGGDVLHTYNAISTQSDNLIYELHRVTVRKQLSDAVVVHHGFLVGIIDGRLHLVLANLLAHEARKLVVDRMAGAGGNDTSLDGFADQCHVADDVEELVARTFVVPQERLVLDIANGLGVDACHLEQVGQLVEFSCGTLLS